MYIFFDLFGIHVHFTLKLLIMRHFMCLVLKNRSYQNPWEATLFSEAPMFARHNQPCNPSQNLKTTILSSGLNSYETNSNALLVPVTHAPNINRQPSLDPGTWVWNIQLCGICSACYTCSLAALEASPALEFLCTVCSDSDKVL